MSAEAEVSDALQKPVDQNAQSAEDVKKMLADLEGEAGAKKADDTKTEATTEEKPEVKTNGTSAEEKEATATDKKDGEHGKKEEDGGGPSDRRRGDRSDGRGRGRGRGGDRGRGRGGFTQRNSRYNIKSDLTSQEESDDPVAIRKQVEFYFSDSNLPRDKFLLDKVGGSQNKPVELKTLHTFKRMRHFQPFEAIVEAMRESTILELCEDDTCVRRFDPLPASLDNGPDPNAVEVFEDKAMPRSIYAKGFGEEKPSTQFDIENFFAEYGATNAVRLRRAEDKTFKGSVFVEFDTEETAKKFLELDPKPKYQDRDLQIMSKKEYCDKKVDDIKAGRIRPNKPQFKPRRDDRHGGHDFKRKRDDEDDRDWRVRREEDRKHGFRDNRGRGRGEPDYTKGGKPKHERAEKDERGVPVVKESAEEDSKGKRDAAREEALAKAREIVEAQNKKEAEKNGEPAEQETVEAVADKLLSDEGAASKKRAREDDGEEVEREVKKVDTKAEVQVES